MFIAHNPNPEHSHIGFRLTDVKSLSQFDTLWSAQPMSVLNEFGGDLPLLCNEDEEPINNPDGYDLNDAGITQVNDCTFAEFITKVKQAIG